MPVCVGVQPQPNDWWNWGIQTREELSSMPPGVHISDSAGVEATTTGNGRWTTADGADYLPALPAHVI